jgi:hypothetical protein
MKENRSGHLVITTNRKTHGTCKDEVLSLVTQGCQLTGERNISDTSDLSQLGDSFGCPGAPGKENNSSADAGVVGFPNRWKVGSPIFINDIDDPVSKFLPSLVGVRPRVACADSEAGI